MNITCNKFIIICEIDKLEQFKADMYNIYPNISKPVSDGMWLNDDEKKHYRYYVLEENYSGTLEYMGRNINRIEKYISNTTLTSIEDYARNHNIKLIEYGKVINNKLYKLLLENEY